MQLCFWITVQRPWSLIASTGKTKVDCLFLDWLNEACCEECLWSHWQGSFWIFCCILMLTLVNYHCLQNLMQRGLTGFGNTGQLNHCWICHPQIHWSSFPLDFPPLLITAVFFPFLVCPSFFSLYLSALFLSFVCFPYLYLFWSFVQCKCLPLPFLLFWLQLLSFLSSLV